MSIETAEQLRAAFYVRRVMERTGIIRNIALTHKGTSILSNMISDLKGTGAAQDTLVALELAYYSGCYQHIVSVLFKTQSVIVSIKAASLAGEVCDETTLERALDVLSIKARHVLLRSVKNHKRTEAAEYLIRIIIERYGYKEALVLLPACSDAIAVKYLPEFINFAPQVMKDNAPRLARIKSLLPLLTEHKLTILSEEPYIKLMTFTRSMIDWPIDKILFHCNQWDIVVMPYNFFKAIQSDKRAKIFDVLLTLTKKRKFYHGYYSGSYCITSSLVHVSEYVSYLPGLENRRIAVQKIMDMIYSDLEKGQPFPQTIDSIKKDIEPHLVGYLIKNEEDIKNAIELATSAKIRGELACRLIKAAGASHKPQNLFSVIEYLWKPHGFTSETWQMILSTVKHNVPGWVWDPLCVEALGRLLEVVDTAPRQEIGTAFLNWDFRPESKLFLYESILNAQGHHPSGASTEEVKLHMEHMYCALIRLAEKIDFKAREHLTLKSGNPHTDPSSSTSLENRKPFMFCHMDSNYYIPYPNEVKSGDCGIGRRRIYRWIEFAGLRLLETISPITVPSLDPNYDDQHPCDCQCEYTAQVRSKLYNWYKTYIHVYEIVEWVYSAYSYTVPSKIPKGPLGDWLYKLSVQAIQQAKDIQSFEGQSSLCHFIKLDKDDHFRWQYYYCGCQWKPCKALNALFEVYFYRDLDQCVESLIHTKNWMAWSSVVTNHICDPNGSPHLLDALLDMVGARIDSGQDCYVLKKKGFGHWSASQENRYKCMLLRYITGNFKGDRSDKIAGWTQGRSTTFIAYGGANVCALTSMLNTTLDDLLPFLPDPKKPETILTPSKREEVGDSEDYVFTVAAPPTIQKEVLLMVGRLDQPQLALPYVLSVYTRESDRLTLLRICSRCSLETIAQHISSSFLLPIIEPFFGQCAMSVNKGLLKLIMEHIHPKALTAYISKILEDINVHRDVKDEALNGFLTNNSLAAHTPLLIDMCLEMSKKVVTVIKELQTEEDWNDMDSIEEDDKMRLSSAILQRNIFCNCVISHLPVLLADTIHNIQIDVLLADMSTMPFKLKSMLAEDYYGVEFLWISSNPCVLAVACRALQSTITSSNDTRMDSDPKGLLELKEVNAVERAWWAVLKKALEGVEPKGGYEPFQSLFLFLNGGADTYTLESPDIQQAIKYKQPLMITRLHRACTLLAGKARLTEGDEAVCNLAMKIADSLLSRSYSYIEALALITRAVPTHNIHELCDNGKVEEIALKHISIFLNALDQCGGIMHDEKYSSLLCSHLRVICDAVPEAYGDVKKLTMVVVVALSKNMDNRNYRLAALFIVQQSWDDWEDLKLSLLNIIGSLTKDIDDVVSQRARRLLARMVADAAE